MNDKTMPALPEGVAEALRLLNESGYHDAADALRECAEGLLTDTVPLAIFAEVCAERGELRAKADFLAMTAQGLRKDAERWRFLRDLPACSFSLTYNDHNVVYETAEQRIEDSAGDPRADYYGDVPADEKAKMIATNTIWTLHVYPNTPVGFNVYHGATLDAAIDAATSDAGAANG